MEGESNSRAAVFFRGVVVVIVVKEGDGVGQNYTMHLLLKGLRRM